MRNTLNFTAATLAATALVGAAPAIAQPGSEPTTAPIATESATGSSAADSASAGAQSAVHFIEQGDVIGLLVVVGLTPLHMLTSGICDLATMSALPDPCLPTRYQAAS
ncbi:hypothetical protein ACFO5K_19605 [Nocardia halotolerans]|uniref:Uncharacterized protein n=1 Tax=Nocardia halotolerans TaxID=1755878 RepID=A0ABV8VN47_9NOCA